MLHAYERELKIRRVGKKEKEKQRKKKESREWGIERDYGRDRKVKKD